MITRTITKQHTQHLAWVDSGTPAELASLDSIMATNPGYPLTVEGIAAQEWYNRLCSSEEGHSLSKLALSRLQAQYDAVARTMGDQENADLGLRDELGGGRGRESFRDFVRRLTKERDEALAKVAELDTANAALCKEWVAQIAELTRAHTVEVERLTGERDRLRYDLEAVLFATRDAHNVDALLEEVARVVVASSRATALESEVAIMKGQNADTRDLLLAGANLLERDESELTRLRAQTAELRTVCDNQANRIAELRNRIAELEAIATDDEGRGWESYRDSRDKLMVSDDEQAKRVDFLESELERITKERDEWREASHTRRDRLAVRDAELAHSEAKWKDTQAAATLAVATQTERIATLESELAASRELYEQRDEELQKLDDIVVEFGGEREQGIEWLVRKLESDLTASRAEVERLSGYLQQIVSGWESCKDSDPGSLSRHDFEGTVIDVCTSLANDDVEAEQPVDHRVTLAEHALKNWDAFRADKAAASAEPPVRVQEQASPAPLWGDQRHHLTTTPELSGNPGEVPESPAVPLPWDEGGRDEYYSRLPGDAALVAGVESAVESPPAVRDIVRGSVWRSDSPKNWIVEGYTNDVVYARGGTPYKETWWRANLTWVSDPPAADEKELEK